MAEGFDSAVPSIARVYDYWLGGKNNFAADRELGGRLAERYPPWVRACRDNRAFVIRAVLWAARRGISQFLDLGAGLPTRPAVHEAVQGEIPGARVAYVDNDPVAVRHAQALLARSGQVAVADADLTRPGEVLTCPEVAGLIDFTAPVCVIAAMVLHFCDAEAARQVMAGYVSRLAPGSVVVMSCARNDDPGLWEEARVRYTPAELRNHEPGEMLSFLGGLDLVPPGLVPAGRWRGGMPGVLAAPPGLVYMLAAAAVKPGLDGELTGTPGDRSMPCQP